MHFQIIQPSGLLTRYIKYYWVMEKCSGEPDVCERVIPNGNIELMFHYKNSFNVKCSDNSTYKQPISFISGINNSYADVTTSGDTGMICVTFHPYGACHFFGFPLLEIENQHVGLHCVFGNEPNEIEEQLCEVNTLQERIAIIERFLRFRLCEKDKIDTRLIQTGIQLINQSKGQIPAIQLSEKLSVTTKTLERKFSALVGKTPKQFIKIVRFQSILNTFSKTNKLDLTEIAYTNGYFDQSHFIKDFKSFSGYTPKDFFANHQCQSDYFD